MAGIVDENGASSSRLTIEVLDGSIGYEEFLQRYLIPNVPCVLTPRLTEDWPAFPLWRCEEDGPEQELHPSFFILQKLYGPHTVPVVTEKIGEDAVREEEVLLMNAIDAMGTAKRDGSGRIYIKDWHLVRQERLRADEGVRMPYTVPHLFADDWMNSNLRPPDDDFRFCYAGMAGTRTNIHRDVYTSYSWSANVVGKKRWRLFPPRCASLLRKFPNNPTSELASNVDEMQELLAMDKLGHVANGKLGWPHWCSAMKECHEVIQHPGETIFVPSGWYHEVVNLTDCISLNHNWCNSVNISSMYRAMCEEVREVENALDDVRLMMKEGSEEADEIDWRMEWTATVQRIVAMNAGWAWNGFWSMVERNIVEPGCEVGHRRYHEWKNVIDVLHPRQVSIRPSTAFVRKQLLPCLDDFALRHDFSFLDVDTKRAFTRCDAMLRSPM